MNTATILQFPKDRCSLYSMAETFVNMYVEQGPIYAGSYLNSCNLPEQLKHQFKNLLEEEFTNRGIEVDVKK